MTHVKYLRETQDILANYLSQDASWNAVFEKHIIEIITRLLKGEFVKVRLVLIIFNLLVSALSECDGPNLLNGLKTIVSNTYEYPEGDLLQQRC